MAMSLDYWMNDLYNTVFEDIGEERMMFESWYYTNRNIWAYYFNAGYSPMEAYASDLENCG